MGRKKLAESRMVPLVCYTTESYKKDVVAYVDKHHSGLTVSTWLLNQIRTVIPQIPQNEVKEELVGSNA